MTGIDSLGMDARTVPELVDESAEILEWARKMGARVGLDNWLQHCITKIERILAESNEESRRELFQHLYEDPTESQNNISDMVHMGFLRRNIGVQDTEILRNKLTLALRGADSVKQETAGNTRSRDARFELLMCARLNERGYHAVLDEPNPDIWAERKTVKVAIECKRVFSEQSIKRQILEGWRQLRDRPGNERANLRVIFCDVTRAFTAGRGHLNGITESAIEELQKKLHNIASDTIKLLSNNGAAEIDSIVLTYQDYIEPTQGDYVLRGITQQLVVINSARWPNGTAMIPRSRRRLALLFFKKLDPKGKLYTD